MGWKNWFRKHGRLSGRDQQKSTFRRRQIHLRSLSLYEVLEQRLMLAFQPDLTVTNVLLGSPTAVVGNADNLSITWTVENQGTWAPTQNWNDSFYLSNTTTYNSSAVFVGSVSRDDSFPLLAGSSYTSTTTLAIPNTALQGNQYLLVVTDPTNTINESNTANNVGAAAIDLTAPNVDLEVSNPSVTTASLIAGNGNSVNVSWTVTNEGSDSANTAWSDGLYLASGTTVDANSQLLGTYTAPSTLAPAPVIRRAKR